jgi:ABC-type nitrate/sulfonate/bicarbonate transport system ATPase subunit
MSPRPTTVLEELRVPFARPRDPKIRHTQEFIQLEDYLLARIGQ